MPGKKPTRIDQDERVDFAITLIVQCIPFSLVKKAFRERFKRPDLCARTIQNYVSRAREQIRLRAKTDVQALTGESLAFYESVIRDPKARHADKLRARERIDMLFGLDAPKRQEITGGGGEPLIPETPEMDTALALVYGGDPRN